jgi:hypothetical protein
VLEVALLLIVGSLAVMMLALGYGLGRTEGYRRGWQEAHRHFTLTKVQDHEQDPPGRPSEQIQARP